MKKLIALVLMISMIIVNVQIAFANQEMDTSKNDLEIAAPAAILIDAGTGKILFEKNKDVKHYPASTTKMITAILAIEKLDLKENIPIDSDTPFTEGSRMYLLEDEIISGEEIMYGMMLDSANDAAVAFGKKISGSIEEFALLMNEKAKKIGAKNTNFVNPNGLHDEKHVSTAYDLAMIARYCMKNETFRKYVATYQHTIPATNKQQERYLYNTNRLLYDEKTKVVVGGIERPCKYEGVTGIKTGYTSHAQGCLVSSAKRNGMELIAVVLGSTDVSRFQDCIALLDYGFENYKTFKAFEKNMFIQDVKVKRGKINQVPVIVAASANIILPSDVVERNIHWEADLYPSLQAPVKKGQKAGVVKVYQGDTFMGEFDAVAAKFVSEGGFLSIFGITDKVAKIIRNIFVSVLLFLLALLIIYIILKRRQIKRKKKRRAERKRREEISRRDMQRPYMPGRGLGDPSEGIDMLREGRYRKRR